MSINTQFLQQAEALLNEKLFKTEELFRREFLSLSTEFKESFNQMCSSIVGLQESGHLDEVAYVEYTLLCTNIINKIYIAEIFVYGEKWYFCNNQRTVGQFDISMLFRYFDELWTELLMLRKRFVGKVSSLDVSGFMMDSASKFYAYVISLCRFSIYESVEDGIFKSIKRTPRFQISLGEYMAHTEVVYKENLEKDKLECLKWFDDRLAYEYCFEDFSGLDFSNEYLASIDLRYSDLRNTVLTNVNFSNSNLIGVRFCGADLEGVDFSNSILYEADFIGANLQNAKFSYAHANFGLPNYEDWKHVGFFGVNFRKADLRGADLSNANFAGADFTDAMVDGAKFDLIKKNGLNLSQEQLNVVVFE